MNSANIVNHFVELCNVQTTATSHVSEDEKSIAKQLVDYMHFLLDRTIGVASTSTAKDVDYEEECRISDGQGCKWTLQEMQQLINYKDQNPHHSFKTLQRKFRKLTDHKMLSRIRVMVKQNGSLQEKRQVINTNVMQKLTSARNQFLPVHDSDLQRWGKEESRAVGAKFLGSKKWTTKFKQTNRIVSRKATTLVTSRLLADSSSIAQSAVDFRSKVLDAPLNFPVDQIFNSDQSPYKYEYHSSRTLSKEGEKTTMLSVISQNKCSHSYTIQPLIDYTGKLRGKLYLCLQEVGGKMGPQVEATYFRAPNVQVTCSASGLLTSSLFEYWVTNVLFPECYDHCLLLVDSWGSHHNDNNYTVFPNNKTCTRWQIPPKTTDTTQPLDVYYFRQWKAVVKRCYNYVMLNGLNINLGHRDNIIKLQSLVHNQFSSDKFLPMGHFAWFKSGLRRDAPGVFENAFDILFSNIAGTCSCHGCGEVVFIRCSTCDSLLCFSHFFVSYHTHF